MSEYPSDNNSLAIKSSGLTKSFGATVAVDSLDIEISRGELFGMVGPDGAGKTTAIRMLSSIMEPTRGDAWVAGLSVIRESEAVKEKIGYMSQRFGLYEDLTVVENILFYADLYNVPNKERPRRTERLLSFSNLTPFKDRLAGRLSGGMKQKLGLACTLIHTPEVLFLDEPTNGVDPVSRRDFWKILYDLLKEGVTIFVSTSYLDEAERCTRVCLMNRGRILMQDDPAAIKRSLGLPMFEMWSDNAREAMEIIRHIAGVRSASLYGNKLHVAVSRRDLMDDIVTELGRSTITIRGHREIMPSIEDIFISRVEGQ